MKRIKCFLSLMLCLMTLLSSLPLSVFAVGNTTETSFEGYIPVSTKEDLNSIRNDLSGKYYLTNNIVFSEADFSEGGLFYNNGEGWNPIGTFDKPFIGVFDGNGYAIINLCINTTCNADAYIGLFGYAKCSEIRNLGCYNGELSIGTTETKYIDVYVGAIVGYRRYNARIAARKRRQRQRMLTIVGLIVVISVIAVISIFLFKPSDTKDDPAKADVLSGAWVYDQYTKYEFDGYGKGCMCLSDTHYEYSYKINGNTLSMDFENEAVYDCIYTFKVENNTLTIIGGEGTTGGTYKLTKK